jgi:hypothetical protein
MLTASGKRSTPINLRPDQGCQMVYFQTKNRNLGTFSDGIAMEDVGKFYGHLVYCTAI